MGFRVIEGDGRSEGLSSLKRWLMRLVLRLAGASDSENTSVEEETIDSLKNINNK